MFWSTTTLERKLTTLITPYDPKHIGRANYTLHIGEEVYISPTRKAENPLDQQKIKLKHQEDFKIPAGQFGFILTEEVVEVPKKAIAFISMRASYKFKGLVNVSGFHVDPEYKGKLIFAVFNAGPSTITLERGEGCFHIWYASTDKESKLGQKVGAEHIKSGIIDPIGEELLSFSGLDAKINDTSDDLLKKMSAIENSQKNIRDLFLIGITILAGIFITQISSCSSSMKSPPDQSINNSQIEKTKKSGATLSDELQATEKTEASTKAPPNQPDGN